MKTNEAKILLQQYAPSIKAPKISVADFLCDLVSDNGHQIGIDNLTGEWLILGSDETILARCV